MRRLLASVLVAAATTAGVTLGTALPAAAADFTVSPTSIAAGGNVQVTGNCEASTGGFAISQAFLHDATHDFAGVGAAPFSTDASGNFTTSASIPATIAPGSYDVTVRCGGGNLGITVVLNVTAGGQLAATGSDAVAVAGFGALLLAAGVIVAVKARRPRHGTTTND